MLLTFARSELFDNILPYWARYAPDGKNGGFVGSISAENEPDYGAKKSLVLNARILWTFSAVFETSRDDQWQRLAERAYVYIKTYFLDRDHGGAFYMLNADGTVADSMKHVYANMFLVYAMSEYARVFGSREALRIASSTANLLYRAAYDKQHSAFAEALDSAWKPDPALRGVNEKPGAEITMNTHLHALEAYTALLRADPGDSATKKRLAEQLDVMLTKVIDGTTHHFRMWFRGDWTPIGREQSFGHDIEGSWLLCEAAEVLDGALGTREHIDKVRRAALAMARACLEDGIDASGAMLYEYDPSACEYSRKRVWWVEAEAVVGFYNAYELAKDSDQCLAGRFLSAAKGVASYIEEHLSDRVGGEWFPECDESDVPLSRAAKTGAWKGPYHSARMCAELIRRIRKND